MEYPKIGTFEVTIHDCPLGKIYRQVDINIFAFHMYQEKNSKTLALLLKCLTKSNLFTLYFYFIVDLTLSNMIKQEYNVEHMITIYL